MWPSGAPTKKPQTRPIDDDPVRIGKELIEILAPYREEHELPKETLERIIEERDEALERRVR